MMDRRSTTRRLAAFGLVVICGASGIISAACGSDTTPSAGEDGRQDGEAEGSDGGWPGEGGRDDDGDAGAQESDASAHEDGASGDGSADGSADGSITDAGLDASDGGATTDDPFDPLSCTGAALTQVQALARLGGAAHVKLADATLARRTRTCAGAAPETCGAWGAPVPHQQALLTYSGGVVTDYKTFSFPTHLVLFSAAGAPKLSVRHASDYMHNASASTRGVVFTVGAADPIVNTYPVINVWDFAPAPNRYEDLAGLLGDDGFLHAKEHCARVVFTTGITTEIAALYRY